MVRELRWLAGRASAGTPFLGDSGREVNGDAAVQYGPGAARRGEAGCVSRGARAAIDIQENGMRAAAQDRPSAFHI